MKGLLPYSINVGGRLLDLGEPQVMGILNVTPDSFYAQSRKQTHGEIAERVESILSEGASIIDIGAYSSRPGAEDIPEEEEKKRLAHGLEILRNVASDAVVSVDTFRSGVARMCVENFGVQIINDISGGEFDPEMFSTVAELGVPYILMHMKGNPHTMQDNPSYTDLMTEVLRYFGTKAQRLYEMGVKDIIIDPGFGFAKTLDHNYELMSRLHEFSVLQLPILAGVSRKSMIYKLLGTTPQDALNGTTVLNTLALLQGASILRVHDVREAVETVAIVKKTMSC